MCVVAGQHVGERQQLAYGDASQQRRDTEDERPSPRGLGVRDDEPLPAGDD
jgi:hypothetical protein